MGWVRSPLSLLDNGLDLVPRNASHVIELSCNNSNNSLSLSTLIKRDKAPFLPSFYLLI